MARLWGARYSPLTQIDRTHAKDLRVVWRWKSPDHASKDANPRIGPTFANESTPLMVGGTLFYKHITVASSCHRSCHRLDQVGVRS